MEAWAALRYQRGMPETKAVSSMSLRRFIWWHGLDHRSLFDHRKDIARPLVPYPLLAAWDASPTAEVDVYWRDDRCLYLSVDRQRWNWCVVCPGQRWWSGMVRDGIPEMREFQRASLRRFQRKAGVEVHFPEPANCPVMEVRHSA